MLDEYQNRVLGHYHAIEQSAWELLVVAQRLCPGDWVLQIMSSFDGHDQKRIFLAVVSNGDDNVTGTGKTIESALASLINYLLQGSVFPLGGGGGQYVHPADRGWIKPGNEITSGG